MSILFSKHQLYRVCSYLSYNRFEKPLTYPIDEWDWDRPNIILTARIPLHAVLFLQSKVTETQKKPLVGPPITPRQDLIYQLHK